MSADADPRAAELRRLASLEPPGWCKAAAIAERFVVRTLRLVAGVAIAGAAIWLFSIAIDILGEPFASLSPLALLGGILAAVVGLLLLVPAFGVAFGAKGLSRIEAAWRESQANTPESRKRLLGYDS